MLYRKSVVAGAVCLLFALALALVNILIYGREVRVSLDEAGMFGAIAFLLCLGVMLKCGKKSALSLSLPVLREPEPPPAKKEPLFIFDALSVGILCAITLVIGSVIVVTRFGVSPEKVIGPGLMFGVLAFFAFLWRVATLHQRREDEAEGATVEVEHDDAD